MNSPSSPFGEIPTSSALAEASSAGDSLSEAVSRFDSHIVGGTQASPEARAALRKIIKDNRAQRGRWRAAAEAGQTTPSARASSKLGRRLVGVKAEDLGL